MTVNISAFFLQAVACAVVCSLTGASADDPSFAVLSNGVRMPRVLLGMGLWCNDPVRCPAPATPCHDCYTNTTAASDISLALANGFSGIDTAIGYGSQQGVGAAVRSVADRASVFLQTKVPGCTGSDCAKRTEKSFYQDLAELGLPYVDSVLLHGPPGPHGAACKTAESCAAAVASWSALEKIYAANKSRSIGVSNYCGTCLDCLAHSGAKIVPHVNQIQYHAGMPGADPTGLITFSSSHNIVPQAYSPLGNYATHSLLQANITHDIGVPHGKSAAQVALRWVIQNNASLCVAASKASYLKEDMDLFSWALTADDMQKLDEWSGAQEDPTRGSCV